MTISTSLFNLIGIWAKAFDESATKLLDFHVNAKTSVKTNLMYQQIKVPFSHDPKRKISLAALPYKLATGKEEDKCELIVILPDGIDGLPALEVISFSLYY